MATGYVISKSLEENDSRQKDITSLNNLTTDGTRGAAEDILLFVNNLRNESTIKSDEYYIEDNFIVLNKSILVPFSNNTIVKVDGSEYKVIESNGIDRFKLQYIDTDNNFIFIPDNKDIIRSDKVLLENFVNLSPERISTVLAESNEQELFSEEFFSEEESRGFYDEDTILELVNDIESNIDLFEFNKSRILILDDTINVDEEIDITGSILIEKLDDNGIIPETQDTIEEDDPGVFISSSSGELKRAFTDSNNPWDDNVNSGFITTQASVSTVGNFIVTDPKFKDLSVNSNTSTEIPTQKYRLPVIIDGEIYNFILI